VSVQANTDVLVLGLFLHYYSPLLPGVLSDADVYSDSIAVSCFYGYVKILIQQANAQSTVQPMSWCEP